jgi:tetratricopeptide (TPR) repeat protein
MSFYSVPAKVNLKMLISVFAIVILLAAGAFFGHRYRVQVIARNALNQGQAAYNQKNWPEAITQFKLYLNRNPDDVTVLRMYALAQEKINPQTTQAIHGAIGAYRQIVRLEPDDIQSYQRLTDLYEGTGNFNELVHVAQRRLEHVPNEFETQFQLAKAYVQLQKITPAKELLLELVKAVEKDPSHKHKEFSEICWLLGGIDSQSDQPEVRTRAVTWLDKAVTYLPDSPSPYLNRARFYRLSPSIEPKNRNMALKDLETAESKPNDDPRVSLELCYEWIKQNRCDLAARQLDNIDRFPPEVIKTAFATQENFIATRYIIVAELARRTNATELGLAQTNQVLAQLTDKSQRIRVLPLAIHIYAFAKEKNYAQRCLDEYLDLVHVADNPAESPDEMILLKSMVDWSQGRVYRVIENLEPIVQRGSGSPLMWAIISDAYLQTGQTRRAIDAMSKYCSIRPDDPKMTLCLAQTYFDAQQWQKAYTLANKLVASDPQNNTSMLLSIQAAIELLTVTKDGSSLSFDQTQMERDLERLQAADVQDIQIRLARASLAFKKDGFELTRQILIQASDQCCDPLPADLRLVELYILKDRIKEAEILNRRLCNKYPTRVEVWLKLTDLYQRNHRYQAAHETLILALDKTTDASSQKILNKRLALLEILHNDRQTGLAMLMKIAQSDKTDLQIRSMILSMPEIYKNSQDAQKLVDEIRNIEGESGLQWRLNQSALWLNTGRWNENRVRIVAYLNRCIEADRKWSDPIILLGQMYERIGELADAESLYRRVLSNEPSMVDVADELITLLEKQRRYAEALEAIDSLHLATSRGGTQRIRILVSSNNVQQAIEELRFQIANHPDDINSRLLLARLTWQEYNDLNAALTCLDEIDAVMPNAMAALSLRVTILNAAGQQDKALYILNQAIEKQNTFESWLVRATFLANIGRIDEAEKSFIHLVSLDKNGQSYELLGKFYIDHQRPDDAINAWQQGTKVFTSNTKLKRRLVKALLVRGKPDDKIKAISMLNELEKEFRNDSDLLWVRALVFLDGGSESQRSEVEKLLEHVVNVDPKAVDAYLKLIALSIESQDYTRARDLAIRSLAANPENVQLLVARAQSEKLTGNTQAALQMALLAMDEDPKSIDAIKLVVECAIGSNDQSLLGNMQIQIRQLRSSDSRSEQLCLLDAQTTEALGQTSKAIELLEAYDRQNASPHKLLTSLTLAELYRKQKTYDRAHYYLQQASQLASFSPAVVRERIYWLGNQHQFDQIVKEINEYKKRSDHDSSIITLAAGFLTASENVAHRAQSFTWLQEVTANYPKWIDAQLQLAWLAFESQKYDLAEKAYRAILSSNPSNISAINNLAWILASQKRDFPSALTMIDRGLGVSPNNLDLLDTRASIFALIPARLRQARQDYQRCLELMPADSPNAALVMLKLADLCIRLNEYPQARECLDRARDIDQKKKVFNGSQRRELDKLTNSLASAMQPK